MIIHLILVAILMFVYWPAAIALLIWGFVARFIMRETVAGMRLDPKRRSTPKQWEIKGTR